MSLGGALQRAARRALGVTDAPPARVPLFSAPPSDPSEASPVKRFIDENGHSVRVTVGHDDLLRVAHD